MNERKGIIDISMDFLSAPLSMGESKITKADVGIRQKHLVANNR